MLPNYCEQDRVWKNIKINEEAHVICFTKENESWKVLLTNLIELWVEILTSETILRKCQTLNPLLNLEAFDWKSLVLDMLNNIPKYIERHIAEVSAHRIELRKTKDIIKLRFSLDLVKETPQQFWENVTMPLSLSSTELLRRHEILLNLVKKKDEEIAEYKAEGAELIRKYIATEPFGEELFRIDTVASDATDFVRAFQSVLHFYNAMSLPKSQAKLEVLDRTSNKIAPNNENVLSNSSKNEFVQELRQDELETDKQVHLKEEYEAHNGCPSTSKAPILKINSMSRMIQKLSSKKNKKTLSELL